MYHIYLSYQHYHIYSSQQPVRRLTDGRLQNLPKIIELIDGKGRLNNRLNKFMTWQLFNHRFKVQAWFWLFIKQGSWGNGLFQITDCVNTLYFYTISSVLFILAPSYEVHRCSSIVLYSWRQTSARKCRPGTRISLLTPCGRDSPLNHIVSLYGPIHSFANCDIQWATIQNKASYKRVHINIAIF